MTTQPEVEPEAEPKLAPVESALPWMVHVAAPVQAAFNLPPAVVEDPASGRRVFADAEVQRQVDKLLGSLSGKTGAAVDVGFDAQGIIVAGAVQLDGGWSVMGTFEKRYSGAWRGQVGLRWAK